MAGVDGQTRVWTVGAGVDGQSEWLSFILRNPETHQTVHFLIRAKFGVLFFHVPRKLPALYYGTFRSAARRGGVRGGTGLTLLDLRPKNYP